MGIKIKNTKRDFLHSIDLGSIKKILDLGCSYGHLSKYFCEKGISSAGVDLDKLEIDMENFRFVNCDIRDFIFEENYDVVIASFVLHFLRREEGLEVIREMKEYTRKGGYNFLALMSSSDRRANFDYFYPSIEEVRKLYSDWEIVKEVCGASEIESHNGGESHRHHLIFLLVRK